MPKINVPDDLYAQMSVPQPTADDTFYTLKGLPTVDEFKEWWHAKEDNANSSYLMAWLQLSLKKGTGKFELLKKLGYYD